MALARIAVSIACGVLGGVLIRSFVPLGIEFVLTTALLSGALCVLAWRARNRTVSVLVLACVTLGVGVGVIRADSAFVVPDALGPMVGTTTTLAGTVVVDPEQRPNNTHVVVESPDAPGEYVLLFADRNQSVSYGDRIEVTGQLQRPESFTGTDGVRVFNYPAYLAKDSIRYVMFYPQVTILEVGVLKNEAHVFAWLYGMKHMFTNAVGRMVPEPAASLAGGITVGERNALTDEWKDIFIATGLIHIVVLSGFNITLIVDFVRRLLEWMHTNKRAQFYIGMTVLVAFVLMTGASSTGVRAGIMASLAMLAKLTNRDFDGLRALLLAGVCMVLWNPYVLVFDPSFQLSMIATFALVYATPVFERLFVGLPTVLDIRGIGSATAATYVWVLPYVLYLTGNLSLIAFPINVLVLPVISGATITVIGGAVMTMLVPAGAPLWGAPAFVLLTYTLTMAQWASRIPFALAHVPAFSFWFVVAVYAALFFIFVHLQNDARPHAS